MKNRLAKTFLAVCVAAFLLPSVAVAQKLSKGSFDISGYSLSDLGELQRAGGESFQGMAISGNTLVSLSNTGLATIYTIGPGGAVSRGVTFKLGSVSKYNHANVANFGVERYSKDDELPLLYVSQTKTNSETGEVDACYVERISTKGDAMLVQTITLDNHDKYYGWAVQWAVDKKHKRLVGFGNTINNNDPGNKFRIMVFKLPKLKQGPRVRLTEKDIIENYVIQDYDASFPNVQIGQGGVIAGNCIVMPTGVGSDKYNSMIYSWNLKTHKMVSAVNMQKQVPYEFEDCDFYDGSLYIQCNKGNGGRMLRLSWNKK